MTSGSTATDHSVGPRLQPAERRAHLLGVAQTIVEEEGTGSLNMEHVAERAGVSRGLVYAYFENRAGLVRALWDEIETTWGGDPLPPIGDVPTDSLRALFEARLVANTVWYFDMIERGGVLFHRLMSEPVLEDSVESLRRRVHGDNVAWWAELVEAIGVDHDRAVVWSTLFNGVSEVLWELIARRRIDRGIVEDVFVTSARAALDELLTE